MELASNIRDIITTVRHLCSDNKYEDAFETFLSTFIISPELRPPLFREFHRVLKLYNESLLEKERAAELFNNIEAALKHYPDNPFIINDLGTYLYKLGYSHEACAHFQKALLGNMTYVAAEKNLNSMKNLLVERWHFRMLNDKRRNDSYKKAIEEKIVANYSKVLDIGSGTGLLSIFASSNNPLCVTAIESSKTMVEISQNVLSCNNISGIKILNMNSSDCNLYDINGKHNLLITEIFDAGLFGEGALQTLHHALEHLMEKRCEVIPFKADVYILAIECEILGKKYCLSSEAKSIINCLDLSAIVASKTPYDTDDIPHYNDLTYLSDKQLLTTVHFGNLFEISKILKFKNPITSSIKILKEGQIDVFALYFDLHLTESIVLTTNPQRADRSIAWQQAIFYNFDHFDVTVDENVEVNFSCTEGKLTIKNKNTTPHLISKSVLRYLNDKDYIDLIKNSIGAICIYLCQTTEISTIEVVDLSPFPLIGFLMMQRGAKQLTCYVKDDSDQNFVSNVFCKNNIPLSSVIFLNDEQLTVDYFSDKKYDLLVSNLNNLSGDVDLQRSKLFRYMKIFCLKAGGLMVPHKVDMMATVVSCEWLENSNFLDDENVLNFNIADILNKFQVSQHYNLDLALLKCHKLTSQIKLFSCLDVIKPEVYQVKCVQDGNANAIICSYQLQLIENGEIISTNSSNSFINGMAFIANPRIKLVTNEFVNIVCCADTDESFKLILNLNEIE